MRGYLSPAKKILASEVQTKFASLSRHRRMKLAETARTTLVKADQWARGGGASSEVAEALEGAVKVLGAKKK